MKPWQQSLREFVDERAETGRVVIATMAEEFCLTHRAELTTDAEAHMFRRVSGEMRQYLHNGTFDSQRQLLFDGMDLPAFIAVRNDAAGEINYVRTNNATWSDLAAGRLERVNNVSAAQAKLESYDESLYRLEPIMASNPTITVGEALQILAQQSAA